MDLSGHLSDYEAFARFGIKTLRIGVLWERKEQTGPWRWSDACLREVEALGIRPIVGLVHHGSGPEGTNLLDPLFAEKLADYALQVANRYAWIDAYTPVNEPNTTARFSGRYGLWYPHHRNPASYLRALLNQVKGTVLSMRAIRRVRPNTKLIQTDDMGRISGTEELRPIWELLNLRQWLAFDLLCGCVDRHHPMFAIMRAEGIAEAQLRWFVENACPPDVVGMNYYVTSDRYLDHRRELYGDDRVSAQGSFIDVEAVRVRGQRISGAENRLWEAWKRYQIPVALPEVHLGCSVDEQVRWLVETWEAVVKARSAGVKCVGITLWALLGSFYWNELVTCSNGHYEPGVFDVHSGNTIPTELAEVVRQIAGGQKPSHAALLQPGWWHHPDRLCFPPREEVAA